MLYITCSKKSKTNENVSASGGLLRHQTPRRSISPQIIEPSPRQYSSVTPGENMATPLAPQTANPRTATVYVCSQTSVPISVKSTGKQWSPTARCRDVLRESLWGSWGTWATSVGTNVAPWGSWWSPRSFRSSPPTPRSRELQTFSVSWSINKNISLKVS